MANTLLSPSAFRELVSGRRQGAMAATTRAALRLLEIPYTAAVSWRNRQFDRHRRPIESVGVPVISVGNITLGGTGKTPAVEWLANFFQERQVRVGLVSRGYGAKPGAANDEALELAQKLPGLPHVLDANRVRGATQAIREFGCQLVLLDDGFQHRRLARNLDIVLVDATEPFGFGHVFPRGTLREPLSGWSRAQVIVLTRAELLDTAERATIREQVRRYAPRALWVEATHAPQALISPTSDRLPLTRLAGQKIAAFCGIGNPSGFRHSLSGCGYHLAAMREFADHYAYAPADIESLAAWSGGLDVAAVLCTGKDLVKIGDRWPGPQPLWALSSQMQILAGEAEFEAVLLPFVQKACDAKEF
jgi:tetraacyldisaccharide 4'-kinase